MADKQKGLMSDYRFARNRAPWINDEQWVSVQRVFKDKWVGMRITPEELTRTAQLPKGASFALLTTLDIDEVLDLRLTVYHSCRARPVDSLKFTKGFPTYPWVCPECQAVQHGSVHSVVDGLRYGVVGRMLRRVCF